jgi:hypothetical protein
MERSTRLPAEIIAEALTEHLGPSTARTAVRTFATRVLGVSPEQISPDDAPRLLEALRPMLRTLLGADPADHLLLSLRGHLLG